MSVGNKTGHLEAWYPLFSCLRQTFEMCEIGRAHECKVTEGGAFLLIFLAVFNIHRLDPKQCPLNTLCFAYFLLYTW